MDIILLPVVVQTSSPADVLKVMKQSLRSAAVVVGSPPLGMITALQARKTKNQQKLNLKGAEYQSLAVVYDGQFDYEAYTKLKLPHHLYGKIRNQLMETYPGMSHRAFYATVDEATAFESKLPAGSDYGFLGYDRGAAVVLTRHEAGAVAASGPPPDCYCKNTETPHPYPGGQKRSGQPCDLCASVIDCG
jgi:hypothetical protein